MNLDHDFVQVWKFSENQNKQANGTLFSQIQVKTIKKKVFHKNRTLFSPNLHAQMYTHSNYGGDADVDHSQTIGGDTARLWGEYIPPSPPCFGTPV